MPPKVAQWIKEQEEQKIFKKFEEMKHKDNVPERPIGMNVCLRLIDIFRLNILDNEVKNNE